MDVVIGSPNEITLKSPRVRRRLEKLLLLNSLEALGENVISYELLPGRFLFYPKDPDEASKRLSRVFGYVWVAKAKEYELDAPSLRALKLIAEKIAQEIEVEEPFAVRVTREGEHEFTSVDAAKLIGAEIHAKGYSVDLKHPKTEVFVEIRGRRVFVFTEKIPGVGGLPLGSEGEAVALISGGIDSPVAARYTMRRGVITHFLHGRPVDSEEYLEHVKSIVRKLLSWSIGVHPKFFLADMREFVELVGKKYRKLTTVLFKRRLLKLVEGLGFKAAVLGDSIGQVASQTLHNMRVIDYGHQITVLRPLAGMDKREIIKHANFIGTLELSEKTKERAARYARRYVYTHAPLEEVLEAEKALEKVETPVEEVKLE